VVFELLAGRRAFERSTVSATSASIQEAEPDWSLLPGSTPSKLRHLLQQCLEKDPKLRPQSASELRRKIETHSSPVSGPVVFPGETKLTQKTFRALWVSGFSVLSLIALAAAVWWQGWQKPQQPILRLISTFPGAIGPASFSPDGSTIAFLMQDGAGAPQIWIKNLAQGDPVQVTFDPRGAGRPRWSPKNDQIIFSRPWPTPGWHTIWSVPPLGGPLRLLVDKANNPDGTSHPEGGRDPSFSWDGSRIVFTRANEIWTANADGSNQRKVEGTPGYARTPTFSPDGSLIAFFRGSGPLGEIWVIPSDGGKPRQLTSNETAGTPVWRPDGGSIVFSSNRGGSLTLWEVAANGGEPRPVLVSAGEDTDPEISRDGRKLIYSTRRNLYSLSVVDPATKQTRGLREVSTEMRGPVFSPAGDKIAFAQVADGGWHLFTTDVDGRNLIQVTRGEGELNHFPRWSWDGSALYFYQHRPIPSFRRILLKGGQSVELVRGWTIESHWLVHVDPQEKLLAHSKIEDGFVVAGTFFREIATGKETLFRKLMYEPQWSTDGQLILGTEVNSGNRRDAFGDIVICVVSTGECRKIAARGNRPIWSHDGSRVYFHRFGGPNHRGLFSVSTDGTDEKLVAHLRPLTSSGSFSDVSPKGEIAYIEFKPGKPELWMMEFR
jgi:Tol biopolymer transport system component